MPCHQAKSREQERPTHLERQSVLHSLALCALLCSCLFPGAQAQQAPVPQTTIRKQVNLVLLDVIVTDPKGTIVSGLRAKDFEILDEDTPQEVVHLSQDEIPLAIALVVDLSGSMNLDIHPMQDGLARAFPALKAEDRIALFSFSDRSRLELGLTKDFNSVSKRIRSFDLRGGTNIKDAICSATDYLRGRAPQSRRIVVLMSDTFDGYAMGRSPKDVEKALLQSEVTLIGVRRGIRLYGPDDSSPLNVDQLAEESGGFMINLHSPNGYQAAFEALIQILKTRYTLGFYPNSAGKPDSIRHLTVRLRNSELQAALPGAMLRYRTQYRVPTEEPKLIR
jgi:VWFA-related protein